jgi:hypothetical protein
MGRPAIMTFASFQESVSAAQPPPLTSALVALWWAAKGDWDKAHKIVMDDEGREAAWVHAYLHRVEGDLPNAGYWYRTAGRPVATGTLEAEWAALAAELLAGSRN